ncbi:unnamed protein product [Wuchereria bancrofti]|uniref:G-protein coupled receptors family 1 profile domain-containing protein n=1 Tax=Wuchereria bancrofti TaxID=6293 RepID=A0A3P7EX63_WUCBA|nr:unnamed protein product [Wuchereria bancrofti]
MVFFCIWVLICGAIMASHYSYGSRETLIIAIILDALLMFPVVLCAYLLLRIFLKYVGNYKGNLRAVLNTITRFWVINFSDLRLM